MTKEEFDKSISDSGLICPECGKSNTHPTPGCNCKAEFGHHVMKYHHTCKENTESSLYVKETFKNMKLEGEVDKLRAQNKQLAENTSIWKAIKNKFNLCRKITFFWQRRLRGFDDSETWNLEGTISEFILPRLIRFKQVNICHPFDLTEQKWDEALDKMILAFELHQTIFDWEGEVDKKESKKKYKQIDEGLKLFAKYFLNLWW